MFSKYTRINLAAWLAFLLIPVPSFCEKKGDTFSVSDSVLLFARPYYDVRVVTPDHSLVIRPPVDVPANNGLFNYPSISPRGDFIAWGIAVQGHPRPTRFALGVYSIAERTWKTYGAFEDTGATAFSLDGSKIAFVAGESLRNPSLFIFDVATAKMTSVPHPSGIPERATLSWSPDGKRLVVETLGPEKSSLIVVFDPRTGEARPIGEGSNPAWSPTGQWVAYYDMLGKKCMLVHPDGTGTKVAKHGGGNFFGPREFVWGPVWSPDGKKLLLNELKGDWRYINIEVVVVDLETGRSTTKSKNGLPVFGWVSRGR